MNFEVTVDPARKVGARWYAAAPSEKLDAALILAHGAGAGQQSHFMVDIATRLAARGLDIVTFNFPYIERHRHVPDPKAVLEATWRAMIGALTRWRDAPARLFIGGKSMGGRIASQVATAPGDLPAAIAGLVFLGYPLHPPGRPDQRRDAHLAAIASPMLFVQGERDAFGSADEMRALVAPLPRADLFIVDGADHSLSRRERGNASGTGALGPVTDRIIAWTRLVSGTTAGKPNHTT